MSLYTSGIRKILSPPTETSMTRDDFLALAETLGYRLASWNSDVFFYGHDTWYYTGLDLRDFKVAIDTEQL